MQTFCIRRLCADNYGRWGELHQSCKRADQFRSEPGPNPKTNLKPKSCPKKKTKVTLGLKNLAMLPSYFDYIFVHLRQKARLRPKLSLKFLSTFSPNSARTRTRPKKPDPTYNSELHDGIILKCRIK